MNEDPISSKYQIKSLPVYYSLNIKVNYKLLDEFDLNAKIELNDRNGEWGNFYRHKSLILLGVRYKFNL